MPDNAESYHRRRWRAAKAAAWHRIGHGAGTAGLIAVPALSALGSYLLADRGTMMPNALVAPVGGALLGVLGWGLLVLAYSWVVAPGEMDAAAAMATRTTERERDAAQEKNVAIRSTRASDTRRARALQVVDGHLRRGADLRAAEAHAIEWGPHRAGRDMMEGHLEVLREWQQKVDRSVRHVAPGLHGGFRSQAGPVIEVNKFAWGPAPNRFEVVVDRTYGKWLDALRWVHERM